jgi:hypothetical protein
MGPAFCYQMLPNWKRRARQVVEFMVDLVGIEPTTSSMPWKRAPSCATGPQEKRCTRGLKASQFSLTGYR